MAAGTAWKAGFSGEGASLGHRPFCTGPGLKAGMEGSGSAGVKDIEPSGGHKSWAFERYEDVRQRAGEPEERV